MLRTRRLGVWLIATALGLSVIGMRPLGWWLHMLGITKKATPVYYPDELGPRRVLGDGGSDARDAS